MKERPILFSGAMVRAILAGTKTQTRRILKFRPSPVVEPDVELPLTSDDRIIWRSGVNEFIQPCPYGRRGDRLWVREAVERVETVEDPRIEYRDIVRYVADGAPCDRIDTWCWQRTRLPGIHMPRGASRLTLEVTGVRVERVQAISTTEAMAEGADPRPVAGGAMSYTHGFRALWDQINGARASWDANPWVWVVAFRRAALTDKDPTP